MLYMLVLVRIIGPVGGDNPLFSHWATGLSVMKIDSHL